jgi:hypothetical protein
MPISPARPPNALSCGPSAIQRAPFYYSCLARSDEVGLVSRALGEVPLEEFFCNGEISHDWLYGYTGVLAVFH